MYGATGSGDASRAPKFAGPGGAVKEQDFFTESNKTNPAMLTCPYCREREEYGLRWLVRQKKDQLRGRADDTDRARFAKSQSYMVLLDDFVNCKNNRCRKRFEISGIKTMAFI
jgi:hypothetical protein